MATQQPNLAQVLQKLLEAMPIPPLGNVIKYYQPTTVVDYIPEPTPLPQRKSEKLGSGIIGVRLLKVASDPTSKTDHLMDSVLC